MEQLPQAVAEILIVEDEIAHAEAIEEGLSRLGHRCTVVHDGESAVARLLAKPFDIVVPTRLGGEKSGLDVLAAATGHRPGAKVILITAHASVQTCRTALQQGAFDYIEKPLDLDELSRRIAGRAGHRPAAHHRRSPQQLD